MVPAGRLRRAVRYGITGVRRRALALEQVAFDQEHVRYEVVLREERPRVRLAQSSALVAAEPAQLSRLDGLWAIDGAEAGRRLAHEGTQAAEAEHAASRRGSRLHVHGTPTGAGDAAFLGELAR